MKTKLVIVGPSKVPLVPISDFTKHWENLEDVWQVIGPTVDMNINRLPVWKLASICYLQGLENGYCLANDSNFKRQQEG